MLDPSDENESIAEHKIQVSGLDLELSLSDASQSGDKGLVHTSLVNKTIDEDEEFIRRENNLTAFKRMIFKLIDEDKASKELSGLSVSVLNHANLPRKPKDYKGKARWEKSKLDNGLPRQYILAEVTLSKRVFHLVEIEKNDENDNIATTILYKDDAKLQLNSLHKIIRDYVQYNGKWNIDNGINKFFMYHTGSESDKSKRLYKRLNVVKYQISK